MIVATLRFNVPPDKKADAIAVLRSLCSQADAMSGCRLCRLYDNVDLDENDDELLLIQRWVTRESMEKHILSPVFQQLMIIMDFASAPPELMFHDISETRGIDLVEDLCRNRRPSDDGGGFQ